MMRSSRTIFSASRRLSKTTTETEPFSINVEYPLIKTSKNISSKCTYCNFNKYVDPNVDNERMEKSLVAELENELSHWRLNQGKRPIRSVYFGGGTPSLARISMFSSLLEKLNRLCIITPDTEVTMESTTSVDTLRALRDIGINRYSLGVQSFQSHILNELGRDHTPSSALRSLSDARSIWPGRVSMDLIMGHAGQTLEDWKKELRFTMDVVDDHLSLYHLTVEPGTALHRDVSKGKVDLPDNELTADMYETMIQITSEAGFEHYEVSNFARNQAYSQHNSGHWLGIDYLGPGAHGRVRDPVTRKIYRTFNIRDPAGWARQIAETGTGRRRMTEVDLDESKKELVVLGMRTKIGVDLAGFFTLTGQELLKFLNKDATESCIEAGLLELTPQRLSPTERGMAVADELVTRILP
ncbi:radical S-adenosyl methionine domain-containing protein 1 [Entomortierella beljakovae]|nr:radical S-adenosyl methionine domain-containing protein 1 [Entomortierella beljakovae]